jgi:hypothetical protein
LQLPVAGAAAVSDDRRRVVIPERQHRLAGRHRLGVRAAGPPHEGSTRAVKPTATARRVIIVRTSGRVGAYRLTDLRRLLVLDA